MYSPLPLQHTDKKASASIACFLAANGADLTIKNRKLQTPLDLCPDPNLCKTLVKCYNERKTDDMDLPGNVAGTSATAVAAAAAAAASASASAAAVDQAAAAVMALDISSSAAVASSSSSVAFDECLLCSERKRDTLFKPCGHVCCCEACMPLVKKCLICRESVTSREVIDECLVCSDRRASVFFKPCAHMVACETCAPIMKKCVECRTQIEQMVPLIVCYGAAVQAGGSGSMVSTMIAKVQPPNDLNCTGSELTMKLTGGMNKCGQGVSMNNAAAQAASYQAGMLSGGAGGGSTSAAFNLCSNNFIGNNNNSNLLMAAASSSNLSGQTMGAAAAAAGVASSSASGGPAVAASAVATSSATNAQLEVVQKLQQELHDIKEQVGKGVDDDLLVVVVSTD